MRRIVYWLLLQTKRLYKKGSFLIILALVPISVIALGVASGGDSGVVSIALARTTEDDPLSRSVMDELMSDTTVIGFAVYPSPSDALEAVEKGEADEAWIFAADATLRMREYASVASSGEPFVMVVGRESNSVLSLLREKLSATLYKHCAGALYIDFIRETSPQLDALSDTELMAYFDSVSLGENMFEFGSLSGADDSAAGSDSYITAPVRGLLGILCVVCGLAASMYYVEDNKRGAYAKIPEHRRLWVGYTAVFVAVANITLVSFVSMQLAGVDTGILRETLSAVIYALTSSAFGILIMSLVRDNRMIGALILPLAVVMIGVCPVFFDARALYAVQMLFPPTYYVNSAYDFAYLLYSVLYSAACLALAFAIGRLRGIMRRG